MGKGLLELQVRRRSLGDCIAPRALRGAGDRSLDVSLTGSFFGTAALRADSVGLIEMCEENRSAGAGKGAVRDGTGR